MRVLLTLLTFALLSPASPSAWAASRTKRVIVTFKSGTAPGAREKALKGLKARRLASIVSNGNSSEEFVAEVAELSDEPSLPQPARLVSANALFAGPQGVPEEGAPGPEVLSVEEDYRVKWIESSPVSFQATPFPSATLGALGLSKFQGSSSAMLAAVRGEIPWGVNRIHAPAAWDFTEGAGVRVAVIDTGIDTGHPDLEGAVDGGYNAITHSESLESCSDDNGHGTHVAGTIAARRNGRGVVGVAPKARVYAVKVLDSDGSGNLSDVIDGVIWAANNGIQVANMSLGSSLPSETLRRALRYAKARGVVIVAAAGNSGGPVGYPAAYPETIAVAAGDWNDALAPFSSRGPEVKFIAPGVAVLSTMMGGDYASLSGTSMACPHVAGLAVLAVSQGYRGLEGPDGVLAQLLKASKCLVKLEPEGTQCLGIIDAGRLTRSSLASLALAR